jgi:hypothetical protein
MQGNLALMDSIADAIKWQVAVSDVRFLVAISCRVNFLGLVSCSFLLDRVVNFRSLADAALARGQLSQTFESLIDLSESLISASFD